VTTYSQVVHFIGAIDVRLSLLIAADLALQPSFFPGKRDLGGYWWLAGHR
jgi:hypothetical protein